MACGLGLCPGFSLLLPPQAATLSNEVGRTTRTVFSFEKKMNAWPPEELSFSLLDSENNDSSTNGEGRFVCLELYVPDLNGKQVAFFTKK